MKELAEMIKLAQELKNNNYKAFGALKEYLKAINIETSKKEGA